YIEHVLPSLGEQDVQLSTISGLKPRLRVVETDQRRVAELKGDARMARVIQHAVADRERPLAHDLVILIDGLRVRLSRSDTARLIENTRRRRASHNENRPYVARRLYDMLAARYKNAAIRAYRQQSIDAPADLALVDEADSLLGPIEAARPAARRRNGAGETFDTAERVIDDLGLRGFASAATLASRFGDTSGNGHEAPSLEPRTFGHLLVDEAQDLTAMQWRMLARRCPSGSMTLVGDPGQASKPGAVASWDDVLSHLPTHNTTRFVSLSINYRTPAEVMEVASRLLAVAAPTVEPSRSVRS